MYLSAHPISTSSVLPCLTPCVSLHILLDITPDALGGSPASPSCLAIGHHRIARLFIELRTLSLCLPLPLVQ